MVEIHHFPAGGHMKGSKTLHRVTAAALTGRLKQRIAIKEALGNVK